MGHELLYALAGGGLAQAVAIGIVAYQLRSKRRDDKWAAQLDRLNRQIRDLYGPLYSLYESGERHWNAFLDEHSNDPCEARGFKRFIPQDDDDFAPPTAGQLADYRRWTTTVFASTNEQMELLILRHADLIVGGAMPDEFLDMSEHVASMRPMLAEWEGESFHVNATDLVAHVPTSPHPVDLKHYIRAAFEVLKREQSSILSRGHREIDESTLADNIRREAGERRAMHEAARLSSRPTTQLHFSIDDDLPAAPADEVSVSCRVGQRS